MKREIKHENISSRLINRRSVFNSITKCDTKNDSTFMGFCGGYQIVYIQTDGEKKQQQ